jgi:hypothetical protein
VTNLVYAEHLARLKAAILHGHTLDSVADWIVGNTTLRGAPFSFKDHEYQLQILKDRSREKVVRKCSQIGISELAARASLAIVSILDSSTLIYTLPTANFAKTFAKTLIDPVVRTSKTLSSSVNSTADNTEIKQFGNSFLYIKGTVGTGAAISVPADGVINDEVDFSDAEVMSNYQSRLTHSPHKLKWKFSTPTVEGYGISAEFAASRRHFNFVKCSCCGHQFLPDYFKHVRVPEFYGSMRDINKDNVHRLRHKEAYVECPKCKGRPSLQPEYREWVVENPGDHYEAAGYQIQPFDAPNIITCSDLIISSTKYKRYVDFENFALGQPAEDKESTLTRDEIEACFVTGVESGFWSHVMGVDMGMVCHIMIAGVDHLGQMLVVKTEKVPLARLQTRMAELKAQYRVNLTVMDSQPYTETLMALQRHDQNLYGAVYVTSKDLRAFAVKKEEEDKELAELEIRQVNVNRNRAFDSLMASVRQGQLAIVEDVNKPDIITHLQDMKRVKDFTSDKEVSYVWRKSASGDDHFHHALLYTWVAAQLRGVSGGVIVLPGLVHKFKRTA